MFDNPIDDLIHLYEDGALNRRELFERLTRHTGSLAAATAAVSAAGLLNAQTSACPADVRVPENAPDLFSEDLSIYSDAGPLLVYQVRPRDNFAMANPAVLVIHENQGLTPYIRDVTRRVGRAGYVGLAIDLLSRQGGTAKFPEPTQAAAAYNNTRPEERRADMINTLLFLRDQSYVRSDRLAAVGFCAGGGNCFDLALNFDRLAAAAVFYGVPLNAIDQIGQMNAALLGIFPQLDRGTVGRVPDLVNGLLANQKTFELHVYENTNHAFHNDTGPRYDAAAACDAWNKTIDFFRRHLPA
jgi:carboxymethylenebutenolidase